MPRDDDFRVVADVPRTPGPHGDKVQKHQVRELYFGDTRGNS